MIKWQLEKCNATVYPTATVHFWPSPTLEVRFLQQYEKTTEADQLKHIFTVIQNIPPETSTTYQIIPLNWQ